MLGVIMVHLNNAIPAPNSLLSKVATVGAKCPQLFFIISAYMTWKSLDAHGLDIKTFWKKRFVRIAPLFYVAIFWGLLVPHPTFSSVPDLISHILFFNGLNPAWINSIMGTEWYIADLVLFYLMGPVLWRIVKDLRSAVAALAGSIVLSIAFTIIINNIVDMSVPADEMYFRTFCIINQLPILLMGIVVFYLVAKMKNGEFSARKVQVRAGIVVAVIVSTFILLDLNKRIMTGSMIAGFAFSFLFLTASRLKLTRGYFLQAIG